MCFKNRNVFREEQKTLWEKAKMRKGKNAGDQHFGGTCSTSDQHFLISYVCEITKF